MNEDQKVKAETIAKEFGRGKEADPVEEPATKTSTKRNKKGGQFMAVKKSAKKFNGVWHEK